MYITHRDSYYIIYQSVFDAQILKNKLVKEHKSFFPLSINFTKSMVNMCYLTSQLKDIVE